MKRNSIFDITWKDRLSWWWSGVCDFFRDFFGFCGLFLAVMVFVVAVAIGIWYPVARCECSSKAEKLGLEYSFGLFQGCFMKKDGKWVDYDRYFVNESLRK